MEVVKILTTRLRKKQKHGKSQTSLYRTWRLMVSRCTKPNNAGYFNYGGRGITVCPEWQTSFEDFEFYVAQLPYFEEEGRTLDRIDNDDGYAPGNVRWATQSQQMRNMRRNHMLTFNGETQCVADWADEVGISAKVICARLSYGWDIARALTQPVSHVHGEQVGAAKLDAVEVTRIRELHQSGTTKAELARMYDVEHSTIRAILNQRTWKHVA